MSVISRSSRPTSCFSMPNSRWRALSSVTRSRVSTAERMEVRGLRISCATSAAKRSMASIRSERVSVMACSERARSPSSSLRAATSGREIARLRDRRTLSAARARRSTGRAISQVSRKDESRLTPMATRMKGAKARLWAAMILSTSTASRVSTPSTASTRWTGMETETTRSPFWAVRMPQTVSPFSALPTSRDREAWARAMVRGSADAPLSSLCQRSCSPPGLSAGGKGRDSTRSDTT